MDLQREATPGPRPVFLGCFGAIVVATVLAGIIAFVIIYADSGANTGELVLEDAAAYAPGTVTFVGTRNFFVVRVGPALYYALSDLDQANRRAASRRCRVQVVAASDPALPGLLERLAGRMSRQAAGATLLFREACNGAVYDVTGVRLDGEGPNLDRYPVAINGDGRLVVEVSKRQCTARNGTDAFAATKCDP